MILLAHMLLGAVAGQFVQNPFWAVIAAILSHYFLDLFPHIEYSIKNISQKDWRKSGKDFAKVAMDFLSGITLIFTFSAATPMVFACAFAAILPDGASLLSLIWQNKILRKHNFIHQEKIHFLKNKNIPVFWRIFSQTTAIIVCLILLAN